MGKVSDYEIQNGCAIPKEKPTKTGQKLSEKQTNKLRKKHEQQQPIKQKTFKFMNS